MIRKLTATVAAMVVGGAAWAAPLPTPADNLDAPVAAMVQKVHGCHFDMGPGMAPDRSVGPHYHNNQCAIVRTGPPRGGYQQRDYYDEPRRRQPRYEDQPRYEAQPRYEPQPRYQQYPPSHRAAPPYGYAPPPPPQQVCYPSCRYVGPFKKCKTICE